MSTAWKDTTQWEMRKWTKSTRKKKHKLERASMGQRKKLLSAHVNWPEYSQHPCTALRNTYDINFYVKIQFLVEAWNRNANIFRPLLLLPMYSNLFCLLIFLILHFRNILSRHHLLIRQPSLDSIHQKHWFDFECECMSLGLYIDWTCIRCDEFLFRRIHTIIMYSINWSACMKFISICDPTNTKFLFLLILFFARMKPSSFLFLLWNVEREKMPQKAVRIQKERKKQSRGEVLFEWNEHETVFVCVTWWRCSCQ